MTHRTSAPDNPRVLVVDDDEAMRLLMRKALEGANFAVEDATNGLLALEAVQRSMPDIVLLDVVMPVMDGFTACAELRRLPGAEYLPILMVTGLDDRKSIHRAYTLGASDFITKPITWPNLGFHVRYMLRASQAFQEIRRSQMALANAQRIARLGNWEWNLETDGLFCSEEARRILNWEPDSAHSHGEFLELVHPENRPALEKALKGAERGDAFALDFRLMPSQGPSRFVHVQGEAVAGPGGRPARVSGIIQDIHERKQAEEKLVLAKEVFENSDEMIAITDPQAKIIDVNPAFCRITGFDREKILGEDMRIFKFTCHDHDHQFYENHARTLLEVGRWQGEIRGRRRDGQIFSSLMTINAIRDEKGEISQFVSIATDITHLRDVEERLRYLAYYDSLTGLPNRNLFQDRLQHAIHEAERNESQIALLFIDLDNFKDINDTMGHGAGDRILLQVAQRLTEEIRQSDTVAYMGGDEFTIAVGELPSTEMAATVARKVLETLSQPMHLSPEEIYLSGSIGIALYPDDGKSVEELIKKADAATFEAKKLGRARYQFFSESLNLQVQERLAMHTSLRHALKREEFFLAFQPKLDIFKGTVSSMEALLRWQNPERGLVSPGEFIPHAEESGLIIPIGEKVLRMACSQTRLWNSLHLPPLQVAVNLSTCQFKEGNLVETVSRILEETGLESRWLELEITESAVMVQPELAIEALKRLRDMGIGITMDDFGTGYSSLSYLKRLPVDCLKIDRSFVGNVQSDSDDTEIIRAIIAMAHRLNLKVIAEGVETREQLEFLRGEGCEEIQGYYFARPMPAKDFVDWLQAHRNRPTGVLHSN